MARLLGAHGAGLGGRFGGAAGGNEIDTTAYRQSGVVQLDSALAEQVAGENLAAQTGLPTIGAHDIRADATQVSVVIRAKLPLGFLGLFNGGPLEVTVRSTGRPHLRP